MVQSVDGEPTRAVIYVRWRDTYTLFGENARLFVEEYGKLRKNIRDADRSLPDLGGFQYWRWNESVFHPFFAEWVERAKTLNLALQVMDIEHPEVHNM